VKEMVNMAAIAVDAQEKQKKKKAQFLIKNTLFNRVLFQ
jgi:hypothetical protein